jgi:tRNA(fMet)-specific endonuclease VapC
MKLLLDTNILIHLSKDPTFQFLTKVTNPNDQGLFISVVSLAELKSLGLQYRWGVKKWQIINSIIQDAVIIEATENFVDTYSEIDAYSQRRNPRITDYPFASPRNMGKNDLWIAATASLLGLKLVTTDADFNHLHEVFIEVQVLKPELFKAN